MVLGKKNYGHIIKNIELSHMEQTYYTCLSFQDENYFTIRTPRSIFFPFII